MQPVCTKCGNSDSIVRMWHGADSVWVCSIHMPIGNTERTLKDILPNREARRRHGKAKRSRA